MNPKSRIRPTVANPVAMNRAVATIDRGERRDTPHTPWPLVHPDPKRVPKPTNSPPIISGRGDAGK
ncbi:hypothetical protein JCM17846_20250 [Iodidimonas nitroreducens]|uniref:Uncharacterized protein n=1 Tax=Iodidimonas nitroreducens TaxID=1236968 RepID=A0A5A7N7N5_9PROT|nr:hypothetical protein JCM17846_20250 [Iodidimonas nitroreducens]